MNGLRSLKKISSDPALLFCVSFIFVLGISIGLTSFNYGALVRFRIPLLPFLATFLVVMSPLPVRKK